MNDTDLFHAAQELAQRRQRWLDRAAGRLPSPESTRRQCLAQARKCEARIVNLAILAELRCERELLQARLAGGGAA